MWVWELMHLYHLYHWKSIVFPCFFPFAFLKALDLPKKTVARRCQLIQAGSEGKWVTGPGLRLHHVVDLRSVRCKFRFRACLSSAELQTYINVLAALWTQPCWVQDVGCIPNHSYVLFLFEILSLGQHTKRSVINSDDHFPSGADSFDLTRLHQLLTEMPKETCTGAQEDLGMAQGQVQSRNKMQWWYVDICIYIV